MINRQISLFKNDNVLINSKNDHLLDQFSYENFCSDSERLHLEKKYSSILTITSNNNRQSVSFQLNKNNGLYGWFKYKEGFSPQLVNGFIDEMNLDTHSTLLDPFVGSGTTSLVGSQRNINTIGIDILPTSKVSVDAKANVNNYDISEIESLIQHVKKLKRPVALKKRLNWVNITKYAYPDDTDYDLRYLSDLINENPQNYSNISLNLLKLAILNSLENLSYTIKAGQYLKWDGRSKKVLDRNAKRIERGLPPLNSSTNKGDLPRAYPFIANELEIMKNDIEAVRGKYRNSNSTFILGSILSSLPNLDTNSIDGVITSPPYLNRYDYTRTYALELAFLGLQDREIKSLRQELISSTVENKSKINWLKDTYSKAGRKKDFDYVMRLLDSDPVLNEINLAMEKREKHGDLNNKGVLRMVKGYFEELGFILFEMHRILKRDSLYYTVNDNVRYGGEVIPVDFISTHLAERFGFKALKVETITQQKGNSSQQMLRFGRVPLRKSITVWKNS